MTPHEKLASRVTQLETSYMHLQNDFESINEVVLENSRRLQELAAMVSRLNDRLEEAQSDSQLRRPEDEKPPHY
ncbi:MAG: SlyX family protein [Planctomycetota bacterium]